MIDYDQVPISAVVPAGEHDVAWSCAGRVSDEAGMEGVFLAEMAVPWASVTAAGLDREKLVVELTKRGPLAVLPTGERTPFRPFTVVNQGDAEARSFAVRMHFAEMAALRAGERVFDVRLQGKTVLRDFDIAAAAKERNRPVIREFKGVSATGALVLEFVPKTAGLSCVPLINGLQVEEE